MKKLLLLLSILMMHCFMFAQTPGLIIRNAGTGAVVLDPDGDGYVSKKTAGVQNGFTTPPASDVIQSEIAYAPIIKADAAADVLQGPNCHFSDLVGTANPDRYALMVFFDGTNVLFRMRMANYVPNSKTYSILIDTDQKFGFTGANADPNALPGNPGFEVEIAMITNFGVDVYKIDGTTNPTLQASNNYSTHSQIAVAYSSFCNQTNYFYDFYVPFAQIAAIPGLNVSTSTPLRFSFNTNMQPQASTGSNSISDEAGLPDTQNPTPLDSIDEGVDSITQCPTINSVYTTTQTIYGNSVEVDGTIVTVYLYAANGTTLLASAQSLVLQNTWLLDIENFNPLVSSFAEGQIVKATAKAAGKAVSVNNCDTEVIYVCIGETTMPTSSEVQKLSLNRGYQINLSNRPTGTLVYIYNSDYTLRTVADLRNGILNPYTTTNNNQSFTFECTTAGCFNNHVYIFRFQEPGKCLSADYFSCDYAGTESSEAPNVLNEPLTINNTSIFGEGSSANAQIIVYVNGRYKNSGFTAGSAPYAFSIPISGLKLGDNIEVRQIEIGKCVSDPTGLEVTRFAYPPTISTPACNANYPISTLSGRSVEASGSTIFVFRLNTSRTVIGMTSILADGTWTLNGLSITEGSIISAAVVGGVYLSASIDSDTITFERKTNITNYTLSINTTYEGATTVSGNISAGTYPVDINLYAGGSKIGSKTITAAGAWTINSLLPTDLFIGNLIQVSITRAGECESGFSSSTTTVLCMPPSSLPISAAITEVCVGSSAQITIINSELNVYYVPVLASNSSVFGYGQMGNGDTIHLNTYNLSSNVLITVLVSKLPIGSCTTLAANAIAFTVKTNPAPPVSSLTKTLCFNKQVEDIEVGLAEFAVAHWYDSPTGGNLIANNTPLVHGTSYYGETELAGCVSSSRTVLTVYLDMVPDTTIWKGETSSEWNDDANWTKGTPGFCSFAIIPNLTDIFYPTISDTANVNGILFQNGGAVLGLQHLNYNKAFVDLSVRRDIWYTLTAPLKSMFSGDYYAAGNPLTQMKLFDAVNPDRQGDTATVGSWTNSFANLSTALNPGEGFAFFADQRSLVYPAISTVSTSPITLHFPHIDAYGNVVTAVYPYSAVTGKIYYQYPQLMPKDTSLAYRFAMEDANGILQNVDIPITGGLNLVGNPLMSHLDFNKLYLSNVGKISNNVKFWNGTTFVSYMGGEDIITDMDLSHTIIPPMQSFFVYGFGPAQLHIDLNQHFVANNISMLRNAKVPKALIHIKASMGNYQSYAAISRNVFASNGYGADDAFKLFSQYKQIPEVYTVSEDRALDINQFSQLPYITSLGIKASSKGEVKLEFRGMESFEGMEVKLLNIETGEQQDLKENSEYIVYADGTDMSGKLFIEFRSSSISTQGKQSNSCQGKCVQVYAQNGTLYVSSPASDKIKNISVWEELGLLLYRNTKLNNTDFSIALNTENKVCVARIETENRVYVVKVLMDK